MIQKKEMFFRVVFSKYLLLRGLGNPHSTEKYSEFTSQKTA
jgi:hypothetical protein